MGHLLSKEPAKIAFTQIVCAKSSIFQNGVEVWIHRNVYELTSRYCCFIGYVPGYGSELKILETLIKGDIKNLTKIAALMTAIDQRFPGQQVEKQQILDMLKFANDSPQCVMIYDQTGLDFIAKYN